jgi:hypothetical protein
VAFAAVEITAARRPAEQLHRLLHIRRFSDEGLGDDSPRSQLLEGERRNRVTAYAFVLVTDQYPALPA